MSRLSNLTHHMASSANDLTITNTYNPASQIVSEDRSNDSYSFTGNANTNTGYTSDGLNRVTLGGSTVYTYDANGNIASDGFFTFTYDAENKLVSALPSNAGVRTLSYDPLNRLDLYNPGTAKRFIYDGDEVVAELDASGNIVSRHVRGDGPDELITWYTSANPSDRGWYHLDQRNSVIAVTNQPGTITVVNRYDEYGAPQGGNYGPFQYTGQMWLGEIGIYNYKNRMYWPSTLPGGRFLQTDPVGPADSANLYQYALNDPVNLSDPSGRDARWEWSCYGMCGVNTGYWNTGIEGLGTPLQRLEWAGWTRGQAGWVPPAARTACSDPGAGAILVCGASSGSARFQQASLQRWQLSEYDRASTSWWNAYGRVDKGYRALESNLETILSGLRDPDRVNVPANQYGLPGGNDAFYQRYSVYGVPQIVPGVLNNPRIFYLPGSPNIYFAPFHHNPGPGVPTGFILLQPRLVP